MALKSTFLKNFQVAKKAVNLALQGQSRFPKHSMWTVRPR